MALFLILKLSFRSNCFFLSSSAFGTNKLVHSTGWPRK